MKRIYLLAIASFLFLNLQAQEALVFETVKPGLKINNISFAIGTDEDMVHGLSHGQMIGMIRGEQQYEYAEMGFTSKDVASMTCENPNLRLSIGLQPENFKNGYFEVSAMAIWARIDAVDYHKQISFEGQHYSSNVKFKTITNEANLGLAYIHHMKALNTFGIRLGAGTNVGYSFGNKMTVSGNNVVAKLNEGGAKDIMIESFDDNYNVKNSVYTRAYLEAGLDLTFFRKVTIGWVYRHGVGARMTPGVGKSNAITHRSIRLFAAYNI